MDAGSFVFDAYGYRWSMDYDHPAYSSIEYQLKRHFGKESLFNMKPDAKRWRMMIFNNRAHSTLTVNDKDHKVDGFATMTDYFSNPGRAGARFDLTPVFGGDLEKAERTGAIVDGDRIEITDHLKAPASAPAHIRWTMLTPARPEITPDGIMLVQKKEKMLLRTSGAPVRYTQWSTDPMDYDSPTREFEVKVANTWLVGFELDLEPGQEVELVTVIARGK